MYECGILSFDLGGCAWGVIASWAGMVPAWIWIALALIAMVAIWKVAGWPGLLVLASVTAFICGRRSVNEPDEIWPHLDDAETKPRRRRTSRPTIYDRWSR